MNKRFKAAAAWALSFILFIPLGSSPARADSESAVLIMAHGGNSQWNKTVKKAVKEAQLPYPHKIFFGMGDTPQEQRELQEMITDLEDGGAHTIYVVPLLISSYSEVSRQWKYLLGVDVQPGFMNNPLFPVQKHSTIHFAEPLNDSSVVVEILLDRTHEISASPDKESVIIVAHGPNDDTDNTRWTQILQHVANRVKERGGFKNVEGVTLRDDAPAAVRQQAVDFLRERVKAADTAGTRVLVVTLLLAPGGIEHKIGLELRGYNYAMNTKTLLPDSRIAEWIRSQVPLNQLRPICIIALYDRLL
jgi:sirohydrochlorin cobaltochelatase